MFLCSSGFHRIDPLPNNPVAGDEPPSPEVEKYDLEKRIDRTPRERRGLTRKSNPIGGWRPSLT